VVSRTPVLPIINPVEKETMERLLAGKALEHRQVIRIQLILNRAEGKRTSDIASTFRVDLGSYLPRPPTDPHVRN